VNAPHVQHTKFISKRTGRPRAGDLVVVNSANKFINAYVASGDFSFANVAFTAKNDEMGIVLNGYSDEKYSILYHYVRVLFQTNKVGIVHEGLVQVVNIDKEDDFF